MPQRTRSHTLEEESWKFFNNSIPDNWVIRKPDPDYGLDAEIEIFTEKGSATGIMFLAQLKATDESDLNKALKLKFKKETLTYYSTLDLPVIIIRYISKTKQQYFIWSQQIDTYYSDQNTKTILIKFSKDSIWQDETPEKIYSYLVQYRKLKNGNVPIPISLLLDCEEGAISSSLFLLVENKLNELIEQQRLEITLTDNKEIELLTRIRISKNEIKVSILNSKGFTLHNVQKDNGKYDINSLTYDLLSIVGFFLILIDKNNLGLEIIRKNFHFSTLKNSCEVLGLLNYLIINEKRIDICLSILESIFHNNFSDKIDLFQKFFTFVILPHIMRYRLEKENEKRLVQIIISFCDYCESIGEYSISASFYYSLANNLRKSEYVNDKKVLSYYRKASNLDNEYLNRYYFCADVAGVLFHLNRFYFSSKFYKKSLLLKDDIEIIPLLADSLLFAGYYKESLEYFEEYYKKNKEGDPEWYLKKFVLKILLREFKVNTQKRLYEDAFCLSDINLEEVKSEEIIKKTIRKLKNALLKDLLCDVAWCNLGNLYYREKNYNNAFFSFLVLSLIQLTNPESWIMCLLSAEDINPEIISAVFYTAYHHNGENLIQSWINITQFKDIKLDSNLVQLLRNLFKEMRKHYKKNKKDEKKILRLFHNDKSYIEIPIKFN